ncbi:MAG: hypothetical protein OXH84_00435 [Gammaproteobacteria bacterium]|nr:hypothetical protein [Gammaproteobacteria bacterium]
MQQNGDDPKTWSQGSQDARLFEQKLQTRAERDRIYIQGLEDKNYQRYVFPKRFFILATCWLLGTFGVILLKGFEVGGFELHNAIIFTMLGTSLAKIFAPVLMFSDYLFRNSDSRKRTKK